MRENRDQKYKKKVVVITFLILSALLIPFATYNGLNSYGQNVYSTRTGSYDVNLTPAVITVPSLIQNQVKIQLTVWGAHNFSTVNISVKDSSSTLHLINASVSPRPFFLADFKIPKPYISGNTEVLVKIDNGTSVMIPVKFEPSYNGIISDIALLSGIGFLVLALYFMDIRTEKYWLLIPFFAVLSVIFGQRYDDYFMISLGARIADGVNPYVRSIMIPPGLYWEYPPGYAPWSYVSILIYHYLGGYPVPTWESLVYLEAYYQNPYSAWRALGGLNLYLLYFLAKIPFVLSFFWIAKIMKAESGNVPWKTWLLNPFAVVIGILWGQLDVLALAFMLQSVVYHKKNMDIQATVFAGLGALIKPFPVFIIPYLLFRAKRKGYALLGLLFPIAAGILLYLASGNFNADLKTIILGRAVPTYLGVFSSNGLTWQVALSYLGVQHFPSLFEYVFLPLYVILSYFAIRRAIPVYTYFIMTMLLFFVTYNLVNPQYLLWIVAAFIMIGMNRKGLMFSILGSLYIALTYSYTYFLNPDLSWNYFSSSLGQIEQLRTSFPLLSGVVITLGIVSSSIFLYELIRMIRKLQNKVTAKET